MGYEQKKTNNGELSANEANTKLTSPLEKENISLCSHYYLGFKFMD